MTPFQAQQVLLVTPTQAGMPCDACVQATLAAGALTQGAGNAEVLRANAQATLNSADATLSAARAQEQNNANILAAQVAATAEIVRANAQATLNSAASTQNAALAQDAIRHTQMADLSTSGAVAVLDQQNRDALAAGTQTAVANNIATQTQAGAVTAQAYAGRALEREEQRQGPITFLWMWCLPVFIVVLASLALWGFWRWLKIQQANQKMIEDPVGRLPASRVNVIEHQRDDELRQLDDHVIDGHYHHTKPDDQVRRWLDEVKRKLRSSDRKDEEDDAGN